MRTKDMTITEDMTEALLDFRNGIWDTFLQMEVETHGMQYLIANGYRLMATNNNIAFGIGDHSFSVTPTQDDLVFFQINATESLVVDILERYTDHWRNFDK